MAASVWVAQRSALIQRIPSFYETVLNLATEFARLLREKSAAPIMLVRAYHDDVSIAYAHHAPRQVRAFAVSAIDKPGSSITKDQIQSALQYLHDAGHVVFSRQCSAVVLVCQALHVRSLLIAHVQSAQWMSKTLAMFIVPEQVTRKVHRSRSGIVLHDNLLAPLSKRPFLCKPKEVDAVMDLILSLRLCLELSPLGAAGTRSKITSLCVCTDLLLQGDTCFPASRQLQMQPL